MLNPVKFPLNPFLNIFLFRPAQDQTLTPCRQKVNFSLMRRGPTDLSDTVTILVFKDNFTSRSFQIPIKWITRFLSLLLIFFCVMTTSIIVAFKCYQFTSDTASVRTPELLSVEYPKKDLDVKSLEKSLDPHASPLVSTLEHSDSALENHLPLMPTHLVSPAKVSDPQSFPILIQSLRAEWQEDQLKIHFVLQPKKNDGSQQGRVIVLARGPEVLLAYPGGVFNTENTGELLDVKKGEFFSVSRFREVNAEFGPFSAHDKITEIEIIIANKDGVIIEDQKTSLVKSTEPEPTSPESNKDEP